MPEEKSLIYPDGSEERQRKQEFLKISNFRQYSWYIFALGIYLFCALAGFGIAYFVVRFLVYMKVQQ